MLLDVTNNQFDMLMFLFVVENTTNSSPLSPLQQGVAEGLVRWTSVTRPALSSPRIAEVQAHIWFAQRPFAKKRQIGG